MVIDSSAIIAVLRGEPDAGHFRERLNGDSEPLKLSAANYLETSIVMDGSRDAVVSACVDRFMAEFEVEIVPVTAEQARIARDAHRRFGRGSGHPAKLNFGDCFAYALASQTGEPLLFKGNDFIHTGIKQA